jgi:hypothetical protein
MLTWAQRAPAMLFYTDLQLTIRLIAGEFNAKVRVGVPPLGTGWKTSAHITSTLLIGLC